MELTGIYFVFVAVFILEVLRIREFEVNTNGKDVMAWVILSGAFSIILSGIIGYYTSLTTALIVLAIVWFISSCGCTFLLVLMSACTFLVLQMHWYDKLNMYETAWILAGVFLAQMLVLHFLKKSSIPAYGRLTEKLYLITSVVLLLWGVKSYLNIHYGRQPSPIFSSYEAILGYISIIYLICLYVGRKSWGKERTSDLYSIFLVAAALLGCVILVMVTGRYAINSETQEVFFPIVIIILCGFQALLSFFLTYCLYKYGKKLKK